MTEPHQINLGDGSTVISDIHMKDGSKGVSFHYGASGEVGKDHTDQFGGKDLDELDEIVRITSSNPDSLQVVINKLEIARDALIAEVEL